MIIRSDCRGEPRKTSAPKREMSKRDALMDIISMAQQARPKVIGQMEDLRAQLTAMSSVVNRTPSASITPSYQIPPVPDILEPPNAPMIKITPNARQTALAGLTLALGILILYLHPADQYFFGDSISTLLTRSLTWRSAFLDFFRLGGTHWYRPLTNGFMQFLL